MFYLVILHNSGGSVAAFFAIFCGVNFMFRHSF